MGYDGERENCELSDKDSRSIDLEDPQYFENVPNYDYYERTLSRQFGDGDCLDGKCCKCNSRIIIPCNRL